MRPDVLLVAGSHAGNITAWDLNNGGALGSFKNNASPVNGLTRVGDDYFMACQTTKTGVHAWTWAKEPVLTRSYAPETLRCMEASPSGAFVAGGGPTGGLHLWSTSTGRLHRSWPAHYKALTCLAWTADGSVLLSAGADGLVHAWLLPECLEEEAGAPAPWRTWPAHTLPVTGLCASPCGALALSVGGDGALCVLGLGESLSPAAAAQPLARHALPGAPLSVVLDAAGASAFVGTASGAILEVALAPATPTVLARLEGHAGGVTCLAVAGAEGALLASGAEDGTVRVWDLRTQQQLRSLDRAAGGGPVSAVLVLPRPPALGGRTRRQVGAAVPASAERPRQPLAALAKFAGARGGTKPWEDAVVCLRDGDAERRTAEADRLWEETAALASQAGPQLAVPEGPDFIALGDGPAQGAEGPAPKGRAAKAGAELHRHRAALAEAKARLAAVEDENARLKGQLERASVALQRLMEAQKAHA